MAPRKAPDWRPATRHLCAADPALARVIEAIGPCTARPDPGAGPFASLLEAILYQQLATKAAATIHARVLTRLGTRRPRPEHVLAQSDEALRAAGLSRQKIGYLRDLAMRTQSGSLRLTGLGRRDDEAVVATLTQVKGVGRWTAEMFLIGRLGRPDILPVDDYGIRKAMQQVYRMRSLPKPARMLVVAEPWRPFRSVACWYLWRHLDGAGRAPSA
jgi:3-methyladenine DNA glycosylase/8-oxoguanine DNA glycosylase